VGKRERRNKLRKGAREEERKIDVKKVGVESDDARSNRFKCSNSVDGNHFKAKTIKRRPEEREKQHNNVLAEWRK